MPSTPTTLKSKQDSWIEKQPVSECRVRFLRHLVGPLELEGAGLDGPPWLDPPYVLTKTTAESLVRKRHTRVNWGPFKKKKSITEDNGKAFKT